MKAVLAAGLAAAGLLTACATAPTVPVSIKPVEPPTAEQQNFSAWIQLHTLAKGSAPAGTDQLAAESAARTRSSAGKGDELAAVVAAGFMNDYVLAYVAEPGWMLGPASLAKLRPREFAAWQREHLSQRQPRALADRTPPAADTGAALIAGIQFQGVADCPSLYATLEARLANFKPASGAVLLSIDRVEALQRALALEPTRSAILSRGVFLLSPNVAAAYRLGGICAVEAHDALAAERHLRTLIAISPFDGQGHLELTHTLVMQHRWEEAANAARAALFVAESRCHKAIAWRKIGFVEIERHDLEAARAAYVKSLQLDPGNHIAISELGVIDSQTGKRTDIPSQAPFTEEEIRDGMRTTVTRCTQ